MYENKYIRKNMHRVAQRPTKAHQINIERLMRITAFWIPPLVIAVVCEFVFPVVFAVWF